MTTKKKSNCNQSKFKICFGRIDPFSKECENYVFRCNALSPEFLDFLCVLKHFGFIYDYVITSGHD